MRSVKKIQEELRKNFNIYATNRVECLKELEETHGKAFVHYGGEIYEDWYYVISDGTILFGFSTKGEYRSDPTEHLIYLSNLEPCLQEQIMAAFKGFVEVWKQKHSESEINARKHMFEFMMREIQNT